MPDPSTAGPAATVTLDLECCIACGQVAEVTGSFQLPGPEGAERYLRTRCMAGHVFVGPEFALRAA